MSVVKDLAVNKDSIIIQKGDLVRINKGAKITFNKSKVKAALRAQNVTIHHIINSRSVNIRYALFDASLKFKLIALGFDLNALEVQAFEDHAATVEIEPTYIVWVGNGGLLFQTAITNITIPG